MDRIVIETTGLADPALILFSILMDPLLTNRFYVEGVVCCLDAANGELHLQNHPELSLIHISLFYLFCYPAQYIKVKEAHSFRCMPLYI